MHCCCRAVESFIRDKYEKKKYMDRSIDINAFRPQKKDETQQSRKSSPKSEPVMDLLGLGEQFQESCRNIELGKSFPCVPLFPGACGVQERLELYGTNRTQGSFQILLKALPSSRGMREVGITSEGYAPVTTPVTNGRPSSLEKDLDLFASMGSSSDSSRK
ncbi:hypothetical protein EK904_014229, partial [Melospiza melodia maxima]